MQISPRNTRPNVKTNKLSIYLIKATYLEARDIIESQQESIFIEDVGHFYFEESHSYQPDWVRSFFGDSLREPPRIFASNARGVLLVSTAIANSERYFAVSFGIGRYMLKDGVVEERFGLKVVLNSIDAASFRSIDKTSLSSVPKHSREQMSREVAPSDFGIDIEQDLVSAVTGKSNDVRLGKIISGRDALTVSVKVDVKSIREFLEYCLERYDSNDYKKNFDWIDQIADVRNPTLVQRLDRALLDELRDTDREKAWMAVPQVIDWSSIGGFRYIRERTAELHDDLDVDDCLRALGGEQLTLEALKKKYVYVISAASDETLERWSIFSCVYAEISQDDRLYVLNNAKWYEVAAGFADEVNRDFDATPDANISLPAYAAADEGEYNKVAAAEIPGAVCMDGKVISYGGGHSSIEFCDILTNDRKLVHVKRYGGSSVLSHLFAQGAVSGELFAGDAEFRKRLNTKLPDPHKLPDPQTRPDLRDYEIVYAVISEAGKPFDIPFFSKVSLRNARRRLDTFGYQVTKKKIEKVDHLPNT